MYKTVLLKRLALKTFKLIIKFIWLRSLVNILLPNQNNHTYQFLGANKVMKMK